MFNNVCRLCLGTQDLIWLFNSKMADNMPEIIRVTSGVDITKDDTVTQMVCSTCCQITIKMFKFRTTSMKNDKDLKARCDGFINQLTNAKKESPSTGPVTPPLKITLNETKAILATSGRATPANFSIRPATPAHFSVRPATPAHFSVRPATPARAATPIVTDKSVGGGNSTPTSSTFVIPPAAKFRIPEKYRNAHPSIKRLVKQYPNIKLPNLALNSHVGAYITLLTEEVDEWFRDKNYNDEDIEGIKKTALNYALELEKGPPKKRGRKRKTSVESTSSTVSNVSTSDKTVSSNSASTKRVKLSEVNTKADSTPHKTKPSDNVEPNTAISDADHPVKTYKSAPGKSKSDTISKLINAAKEKLHIESHEKSQLTKELDAKLGSNGMVKSVSDSESDITDISLSNVKSNVTLTMDSNGVISHIKARSDHKVNKSKDSSARTRRNSKTSVKPNVTSTTKTSESSTPESGSNVNGDSGLNSMLKEQSDNSPSHDDDFSLTSLLGYSKRKRAAKKNYIDLGTESDADDLNYEPMQDDACDSNDDKEEETPTSSTNDRSATVEKASDQPQEVSDGPQENLPEKPPEKASDAPKETSSNPDQQELSEKSPEDDITLFTTRRFLRSEEEKKRRRLGYQKFMEKHGQESCELFVLSDTDSDDKPIIVENPGESTKETDKDTFVKSLELAPKDLGNQPDLSLVSVANKSSTLHICNICDAHRATLKDLKIHQRKAHTKCPFCNKRFRSLAARDEHVKYTCIINNSPFELRNFKIELTRVDEIEEIRNKYPDAFKDLQKPVDGENETELPSASGQLQIAAVGSVPPQLELDAPGISGSSEERNNCDKAIDDTVKELEKFLQTVQAETSTEKDDKSLTKSTDDAEVVKESTRNDDIICISDDEGDKTKKGVAKKEKPKISVVNHEIIQNINGQDNDMNILRKIVIEAKSRRISQNSNFMKENCVIDGSTPKVKVFKNLRKHLQSYTIPIEISYSPNLNVEYKHRGKKPIRKFSDLWYTMPCEDLQVWQEKPKQPVNVPRAFRMPANTYVQQQTSQVSTSSTSTTSSSSMHCVNIVPRYSIPAPQVNVSAPNSLNPNTLLLQALAANSASKNVIRHTNALQTIAKDVQGQNLQYSSVRENISTAVTNLVSSSVVTSCNIANYATAQMLYNVTPNLSASTSSYIIVAAPLVTSKENGNITTNLAPLPVIKSVSSGQEVAKAAASSTDSGVSSGSSSSETATPQPSIRVRNLSELS